MSASVNGTAGALARNERAARNLAQLITSQKSPRQNSHLRRVASEGARVPSKGSFANSKLT